MISGNNPFAFTTASSLTVFMCGIQHKRKTLVLTLASSSLTKGKRGGQGVGTKKEQ